MTREEKIEAAAAKLLARLATMTGDPFNPEEDDLRDAMALPREESAEGWTFAEWFDGWRNVGELRVFTRRPLVRAVRVRILAAPEGDAP